MNFITTEHFNTCSYPDVVEQSFNRVSQLLRLKVREPFFIHKLKKRCKMIIRKAQKIIFITIFKKTFVVDIPSANALVNL